MPAKSALKEVATFKSLEAAWAKLWSTSSSGSRDAYGVDEVSLNDFAKNHVSNLRIISKILRNKNYEFSPLRPHFIEKATGGFRVICVPTTSDRVVQGALLAFLSRKYTSRFSNKISYGFLKNRKVQDALTLAAKYRKLEPWVYKTDIESFFDTIPRAALKMKVCKVIREKTLHNLINNIIDCEIHTHNESTKKKIAKKGIKNGVGVRQGMPLSPFLSNVVLESFDNEIESVGYSAIRYADDLIFFSKNKKKCFEIDKFCIEQMEKEGFTIPKLGADNSKTVLFNPNDPAEFLGLSICKIKNRYAVLLLEAQIQKIRKSILDLGNIKELLSRKITLGKLSTSLRARIGGYFAAYDVCENLSELKEALDGVEQEVLKRIYVDGLKIDITKLSSEAYTFLGLRYTLN